MKEVHRLNPISEETREKHRQKNRRVLSYK